MDKEKKKLILGRLFTLVRDSDEHVDIFSKIDINDFEKYQAYITNVLKELELKYEGIALLILKSLEYKL